MSKVLINDTTMIGIADAIRSKDGSSAKMLPSEMANKIKALASVDLMFYKTTSPKFTGKRETISLTNLPYLPFIIAIVRGSFDSIPDNFITSGWQCALYGRYNAEGGKKYLGVYNEEQYSSFDIVGRLTYTKKSNGTYDINNIPVFSWYISGSYGGNDYTAILIGKGEE